MEQVNIMLCYEAAEKNRLEIFFPVKRRLKLPDFISETTRQPSIQATIRVHKLYFFFEGCTVDVKELNLKQTQKEIHSILVVWHKEYKLHQTITPCT
jgi:hypothetical protein